MMFFPKLILDLFWLWVLFRLVKFITKDIGLDVLLTRFYWWVRTL